MHRAVKIKIVGHYANTTVAHYGNVFVHKDGKLENRQFLTKMPQIAPNCVSNFKLFAGLHLRTPIPREGTPPPQTPPRSSLCASTHGLRPLDHPPDTDSFIGLLPQPRNKRLDKALYTLIPVALTQPSGALRHFLKSGPPLKI